MRHHRTGASGAAGCEQATVVAQARAEGCVDAGLNGAERSALYPSGDLTIGDSGAKKPPPVDHPETGELMDDLIGRLHRSMLSRSL